ncbi:hypothetical protein [Vibrio sp. D54]|uniref:hypothetical protein n=1 Tax=Vibrio sp. D54 TaxID=2912256 RepID=UPI001F237DE3|nr:hypothetical protein [Vibrio sp. D54]MCF7509472.1 hypothetical protein [Vibrio sp. D54]
MKLFNYTFTAFTLLLMVGCGEGSSNESTSNSPTENKPTPTVAISALDVSTAVYVEEPAVVNLKSSVMTSDNSPAVLASVTPVTEDSQCNNYTVGNMNFTVNGQAAGVCIYEYEVEDVDASTSAHAYAQVAISGSDAPLVSNNNLPTLSAVAQVGESITIQLTPPTATNGVDKMTLSTSTTVLGAGVVSDVDVNANSITYTAGSSELDAGITRIFYSYYDEDDFVRMGNIDVAVSTDTYNQAPEANDWTYVVNEDLALGQSYTAIKEQEEVTVDLEQVYLAQDIQGSLISDEDSEDQLQLINLQVFNADVGFVDKADMDNKSFTFTASRAGNYYVTYTVSDHKGGYASGIVEFHVQGTWPDVIVDSTGDVFAAPLSLEAATIASYDVAGIAAEASAPNGNGYSNVPTYTWDAANSICKARGGSLPTYEQLSNFITQEQNPFLEGDGNEHEMASGWPIARAYFTSDFNTDDPNQVWVMKVDPENGYSYFDYVSSGIDGVSEPYLGYLTCIDKTPKSLSIENEILLMEVDQTLSATFATASGVSFPYTKPLYWYASEPEDDTLEAMPDIENNVQLNKYSGDFYATEEGFIHIKAETPLGDLSTEKDIEVLYNLFASGGADPNFLSANDPTASACEQITLSDDKISFATGIDLKGTDYYYASGGKVRSYLLQNCSSEDLQTANGEPLLYMQLKAGNVGHYSADNMYLYLATNDNSQYEFDIPYDGDYWVSIDFRLDDDLVSAGIDPFKNRTIRVKYLDMDSSKTCSAENTTNTDGDTTKLELLNTGWYRLSCKVHLSEGARSGRVNISGGDSYNNGYFYARFPMLIPAI